MKPMGRLLLWGLLLLSAPALQAVDAGDAAPAWESRDLTGNPISFPDVDTGTTTVMVFWATWCPYCKAFMPYLPGIEADYADRGVRVLAVNCREEEKGTGEPAAYIRSHGYRFRTVLDGNDIARAYGVHYIPGLLIIGTDGTVVYRRKSTDLPPGREVAEFWDGEVRAVLDRYLR